MKRVAITGSSGYLGRTFIGHLRQHRDDLEILGLDVRPPAPGSPAPHRFVEADVLDARLDGILDGFRPDTLVHAAFVLAPIRDHRRMHRINVDGSRKVLECAARCEVERLMLVSSATAYGAWPDNPVPMDEAWPLRPASFQYAADKVEIETLAEEFAGRHPGIALSRIRPAIVGGAGMDNYLSRFIFGLPALVLIDGCDTPLQFVHEHDVAAAMLAILAADARGAFNIGPPDWSPISQIADETGRPTRRLPFWLVRMAHGAAWILRLPGHETPAEFLDFARHPWVVRASRLERELGYRFRYTSLDTLREIVRSRRPGEHAPRAI